MTINYVDILCKDIKWDMTISYVYVCPLCKYIKGIYDY